MTARFAKALAWILAASYFGIAAIGGSAIAAAAAISCGYLAGRSQS